MKISSTFHADDLVDDALTYTDLVAKAGVYGSGNDKPAFVSILGLVCARDLVSGELSVLTSPVDGQMFRGLPGELDITLKS